MANHSKSPLTREVELAAILERKLDCAIQSALRDDIPLTFNSTYRAVGYTRSNPLWDYRRDVLSRPTKTFLIDSVIVGRKIVSVSINLDIARCITLPSEQYIYSLIYGITNQYFYDLLCTDVISAVFYGVGARLRAKFKDTIAS